MSHRALRLLVAGLLATTASCSQREDASQDSATERAEQLSPDVSPSAAPGVAFAYRYTFGMPDATITAAQEAHAGACEKLGLDRCRITGMTFNLDDRDRVSASLDLSIDPSLARGFGKQSIAEVDRVGGRLRFAEITGEDQNPALAAAAARAGEAEGAARSIDVSLNETAAKFDRSVLREDARQARSAALAAREQGDVARARLAATPMHLQYQGGGAGRGFAGENPAREAWYLFIDSLATMVGFALKALAVALPWLALLALLILAARTSPARRLRAWWSGRDPEDRSTDHHSAEHPAAENPPAQA